MRSRYLIAWILSIGSIFLGTEVVRGQDYPKKAIRIVTSGAGGAADFSTRLMTPGLSASLGQAIVIDNRPAGVIPGEIVSRAPADGYTLLVAGTILWIGPLLQKMPYDVVNDFTAVSLTGRQPNLLVVYPPLPVNSVKELIALAKAKPGELNYASQAPGSSSYLAAELFKAMAGVNIAQISFKSAAQGMTDTISGRVQLMFPSAGEAGPHVKGGRLKALAVTSIEPSALFPTLPTVAASGLTGYKSGLVTGVLAPAHTPVHIVKRLNQEIVRALLVPDVKEKFLSTGVEVVASSPEEFAAAIKSETAVMGKIIRDAAIGKQ